MENENNNVNLLDLYRTMLSENRCKFNVEECVGLNDTKIKYLHTYIANSKLKNMNPVHNFNFSESNIQNYLDNKKIKNSKDVLFTSDGCTLLLNHSTKEAEYSVSFNGDFNNMEYSKHVEFIKNHGGTLDMIIPALDRELVKERLINHISKAGITVAPPSRKVRL